MNKNKILTVNQIICGYSEAVLKDFCDDPIDPEIT